MQTPILLTRAAAARRLDVTPAALDRLKIRTIRVGRRRMFRSEDILERVRGDVPDNAVEALAGYLGSRVWSSRSPASALRRQFIETSHPARANLMQFWFHGSSPLNGLVSLGSARNFGAKVRGSYT